MKVTRSEGKAGPGVVDAAPTLLYDDNPGARYSKVSITFRSRKAVLCLPRLHSIKFSVNEAKLTVCKLGTDCAIIQQVLI